MKDLQQQLLLAVNNNDLKQTRELIKKKVDLNFRYSHAQRVLMDAAAKNELAMVKLLVENGADVNQKNLFGMTALWNAAQDRSTEIFLYLIDKGAKISYPSKFGPLLSFVAFHGQLEILKLMLNRKVQLNQIDINGDTAITKAASEGQWECVKILVKAGANPKIKNFHNQDLASICKAKRINLHSIIS